MIAQGLEHQTVNLDVEGSNPSQPKGNTLPRCLNQCDLETGMLRMRIGLLAEKPVSRNTSKAVSDRPAFRDDEDACEPARRIFECSDARSSAATSTPESPRSANATGLRIVLHPQTKFRVHGLNYTPRHSWKLLMLRYQTSANPRLFMKDTKKQLDIVGAWH